MKEQLTKYLIIAFIIILGISIYLGYSLYKANKQLEAAESIYQQNELSKKEIEILKKDNVIMYKKYAEVTGLNKEKEKILKEKNETIIVLNAKIFSFQTLTGLLQGEILNNAGEKDTNKIPSFLVGKKIKFEDKKDFYTFSETVTLANPPTNKYDLSFFQDIKQTDYLTRDKEGKFSGYSKFSPDFVNNYIKITRLEIKLEKDEFVPLLKLPISWMFFVDGDLVLRSDGTTFTVGGSFIKDEKWKLGYQKGVSENLHIVNFGYRFFSIK